MRHEVRLFSEGEKRVKNHHHYGFVFITWMRLMVLYRKNRLHDLHKHRLVRNATWYLRPVGVIPAATHGGTFGFPVALQIAFLFSSTCMQT